MDHCLFFCSGVTTLPVDAGDDDGTVGFVGECSLLDLSELMEDAEDGSLLEKEGRSHVLVLVARW